MSRVFIVLTVRDDTESKYPSIVFLSIYIINNLLAITKLTKLLFVMFNCVLSVSHVEYSVRCGT